MLNKFAQSLGCHWRCNGYSPSHHETWQSQNENQESYSMVNAYMASTPPPPNHQMMFEGVTLHQEAWNDKKMSQNHVGRGGSLYQSGWEGGDAQLGSGMTMALTRRRGSMVRTDVWHNMRLTLTWRPVLRRTVMCEAVRYESGDGDSYRRQQFGDGNKWQCGGHRQNFIANSK